MKPILLISFLFFMASMLHAQRGPNDTILVGAVVIDGDTLPHIWFEGTTIYTTLTEAEKITRRSRRQAYDQLRRNVRIVYPYAVAAAFTLHDIDSALATFYSKEAKKVYKLRKEDELNKQFKHKLVDLTITQGQILVKLIARQTGKPCYQIIKDLKGGFNARIWQTVALLFDNNLKNSYNGESEDEAIERIVLEIEHGGHLEPR